MAVTVGRPAEDTTIRPFTVETREADLKDLRARIAATRWPDRETVDDDSQGVPLKLMQDLARYWQTDYDWRKCEARLNALPNFITEIDGLDIHFVHVRSKHEDALPIVVCHGWPGSVVEELKLIGPLTDPTAHGASASDAFDVVIPSMPGYGFSGKPTGTGWDPVRIGKAYVELMKRLGYDRFVAQGGDWGAIVVDLMAGGRDGGAAEPAPPELVGIHTNMAGAIPPDLFATCVAKKPRSCSYVLSSSSESSGGGGLPAKDARKRSGGIAPAMLVWMPISSGGAGSAGPGLRPPAIRSTTIAPQSPPCATKRS